MKNKLIATILVGTLIIGALSGCGNSSQKTTTTVTQSEETTVETTETKADDTLENSTNDESTQEDLLNNDKQEQNDETIDIETETAEEAFNEEQAFNKIAEMFNARNELFAQGSLSVDLNFLFGTQAEQKFDGLIIAYGDIPLVTKDGIDCDNWSEGWENGPWVCVTTTLNYFYNYINNNTGYYSLEKYVQEHTSDEIYNELGIGNRQNGVSLSGCDTLMYSAVWAMEYLLQNIDTLEAVELLEGDAITTEWTEVSGIPVYYQLPLIVDGEYTHLDALYDESGNLLNIVYDDIALNNADLWLNCAEEIKQLYSE